MILMLNNEQVDALNDALSYYQPAIALDRAAQPCRLQSIK